jgi:hypothetical protein
LYQLKPARKYFVTDLGPVCLEDIQNLVTCQHAEAKAMPVTKLNTIPTVGSLCDEVSSYHSG